MLAVSQQLTFDPTALDWSPNGKFLVAGDRNGSAQTFDAQTLLPLGKFDSHLVGKKNAWVQNIRFSPDGKFIAFGSHGGLSRLEVASVADDGSLKKFA